jgi:protein phosphatase
VTIEIPSPVLVLLVGPSGAGKSTFARRHFRASEVLSSDFCRALVSDDEADQSATKDAFELLHLILAKRLQRGRVTVVDATNVHASARRPLLEAAQLFGVPAVGILFQLPESVYQNRNQQRPHRKVQSDVIVAQVSSLKESLAGIENEGFARLYRLTSVTDSDSVIVKRLVTG